MDEKTEIRNIGIFAHVDAGKTTLAEGLLFRSGAIKKLGSVDEGTASTDRLDVERERGISVRAALASLVWQGSLVNLVDTPGHVDFSAEVERSLQPLDGAVVLLSAVEGVQAQTEAVWQALQVMGLPTLFFVNKMDRMGADPERVLDEIGRFLTPSILPLQRVEGDRQEGLRLVSLWPQGERPEAAEAVLEALADADEALMARFLEGESFSAADLDARLVEVTRRGGLHPVLFGAALEGLGVEELLDAIVRYLPAASGRGENPLSGLVFKVDHDAALGRLCYVRIFDGALSTRDRVRNGTRESEEKVTFVRRARGCRFEEVNGGSAGDIVLLSGLRGAMAGDVLGDPSAVPRPVRLLEPLFRVRVVPGEDDRLPELIEALRILDEEDPFLHFGFDAERGELHIRIAGLMQTQILESLLRRRFGLTVSFEQPSTLYRETPLKVAEGHVEYTLPKPCWAVMTFRVEPAERGSGLSFVSEVSGDAIHVKYQREVERALPAALEQGLWGWKVTDLKVTLVSGEDHEIHSRPSDFLIATAMGVMDALDRSGTRLLEPLLSFSLSAPEEIGSRILGDLVRMRAQFESPVISGGQFQVKGTVPAADSMEYPVLLGTRSGGRARMTTRFAGYRECAENFRAETPRRGIDPRDRSKYILAARKALS